MVQGNHDKEENMERVQREDERRNLNMERVQREDEKEFKKSR
jgi:hypothetical protein